MKVKDIYNFIDSFAPFTTQEDWDNSGLLIGDPETETDKVLVALDVTENEIIKAEKAGAGLIVTHHPVIFRPCRNVLSSSLVYKAVRKNISVISAHTNLDKAPGGVNDTLCEVLDLDYKKEAPEIAGGFLNTGNLKKAMCADELAVYIKNILGGSVNYSDGGKIIKKVAVCSGSGAEFTNEAMKLGCEAFITGDASYHAFLDAKNLGLSVFAAGHYETEVIIVKKLIELLSAEFKNTEFIASDSVSPIVTVK